MEERARILDLLPGQFAAIEHIGSTAVPSLSAKPIIDMLAGVGTLEEADTLLHALCSNGYTTSIEYNATLQDRRWLMRHASGRRTHHLHLAVFNGEVWLRWLQFRDLLRADPALAASYEQLKQNLAERHRHDREAYTRAKSAFIEETLGNHPCITLPGIRFPWPCRTRVSSIDKPAGPTSFRPYMRPTLLALALFTSLAAAQEKPGPPPEAKPDAAKEKKADKPSEPVIRDGSVTIDGKKIDYQVVTSKLVLEKDDGAARASVFHVSYLKKNAGDLSKRPVLFAFNGGPGSSAVWLHLGTLGPKRVDLPGDGTTAPVPPARLVPNEFSILDVADLVFVDPVSTGYSRIEKDGKPDEFHGVEGDVESLSDFIRRWITDNQRWSSPKYLLGESYGGIRVAGLSANLQSRYGMSLNGVVLLSSLLDFRTLSSSQGDDLSFQVFLPLYTSVAHFHGKLKGDRNALLKDARAFAAGDYATALLAGSTLDPAKRKAIAEKLSALTSLPVPLILEANLRIDPTRFRGELLRKEGKVVGRFDARVAWPTTDPSSDIPEYDPSFSLALGAYSTTMLSYLGGELGWKEDSPYEILTGKVHPWKMGSGNGYVNMSGRLATAMRDNPHLRVLVMGGLTDLATPPDGIAYSLSHLLDLPEAARKNIVYTDYEAGHMFYLNPPDLVKGRKDLVDFINAGQP